MEDNNVEPVLLRELTLIRHGESKANAGIDPQDDSAEHHDSSLSDFGLVQAEKLRDYLADYGFDAVFSSGLRRAAQTAAVIAEKQKDKSVSILPAACEIGMDTEYKGQSLEDLSALCPGVKISLATGVDPKTPLSVPDECPYEHEERYFERAKAVLDYMSEHFNSGEKAALVSHAGFLTYMIFRLLGFTDFQPRQDFRLSNTGMTRILFFKEGTNKYGDVIFDCVNERPHLKPDEYRV